MGHLEAYASRFYHRIHMLLVNLLPTAFGQIVLAQIVYTTPYDAPRISQTLR